MAFRNLKAFACALLLALTCFSLPGASGPGGTNSRPDLAVPTVESPATDMLGETVNALGYRFVENLGQIKNSRIRFYAEGDPLSIGITPDGLEFVQMEALGDGQVRMVTSRLTFEGALEVEPVGQDPSGCLNHIYMGDDPTRWVHGAREFREVVMEHVYDGVDVRYYFTGGRLKYDIDVDQDVDLADIVLRYEGMDRLSIDPSNGDLLARTAAGLLRDERPLIIQAASTHQDVQFKSDYRLLGGDRVTFSLPDGIDPSLPMTVDPGIEFSTLFGGDNGDYMSSVMEDSQGRVHVVGSTASAYVFPEITGVNLTSTVTDIYGLILPRIGDLNITSYRIGGDGGDSPSNLYITQDDRIFIGGGTYSTDFPKVNALDDTLNGDDGYILCLNGDASDILFSTYFGGSHSEYVQGFKADDEGNLFLFGGTLSTDLPCTPGAYCRTLEYPASQGGFVARFTSTPPALDYCTYVNGADTDCCFDVMIDGDGRMLIAGYTNARTSSGFPVTPDAFCTTKHLNEDGYIVVLDPTGSTMEHGTYLGANGVDTCRALLSMPDGSVLAVGSTSSLDFPTTPGAFSRILGGTNDAYLSILDANLTSLRMSSYFGGSAFDSINCAILSNLGDLLVLAGDTVSTDLPVSDGTFDPINRGYYDTFLAVFDTTTWQPEYCTFIGGSGNDSIASYGVVQNKTGTLLVCGDTDSPDFPTTGDAFYTVVRGGRDGFLLALDLAPPSSGPNAPRDLVVTDGDHTASLGWSPPLFKEAQVIGYWVYRVNTTQAGPLQRIAHLPSSETTFVDYLAINGQDYHYSVSAENSMMEGLRCDPELAHPLGMPSPPRILRWETGGGTVNLSWDPPSDDGGQLDGYYVLTGDEPTDIDKCVATLGSSENGWIDTQVSPRAHFYYLVVAFNPVGDSTPSNLVDAVPLDRPSKPTNVTAQPDNEFIRLAWDPPSSDGGSRIRGYRIIWGNANDVTPNVESIDPAQFQWRHSGLTNGLHYYYYIEAFNDNGTSDRATPNNFPATPFGPTSAPRDLVARPGDASVLLTWKAPFDYNGAPVSYYIVHISTTGAGSFNLRSDPVFEEVYNYTGAVNDQAHYFQVTAINDGGESPPSNTVNATPIAIPGQPTSFSARSVIAGIGLSWTSPDWTSIYPLGYAISRGTSDQSLENLTTVSVLTSYLDTTAQVGRTYCYRVVAVNAAGNHGLASSLVWETRATIPGDVTDPSIVAGDKEVVLTWAPPSNDGGSEVLQYKVLRGSNVSTLIEVHALQNGSSNWTDKGLINGQEYTYTVLAVNSVGTSPINRTWSVKPLAVSGMVLLEPPRYKDGKVLLSWTLPDYPDKLPPTSFIVYKGRLTSSMEPVATIDSSARNWSDGSVDEGKTYYYCIQSICTRGPGGRTDPVSILPTRPEAFDWLPILIIVILVILVASMAMVMGRRREVAVAEPGKAGGDLIVEAGAPLAPTVAGTTGPRHLVEEVFVIYKDGRLIAECSRDTCKTADADLMSGMLVAVQGIVQEGLQKGGELESIKYGESLIVLKSGAHVNVAAIIYGEPDAELTEELEATVERIEVSYSGIIEHWDGDLTPLTGMTEMVKPLFERTATVTRADVKGPAPAPSVSLLSSVDFHRGYVRLKLAVVNAIKESVTDASIEVHYDHDMLRLERIIPVSLEMRGDSIILGNVRPAERKSVTLLLDPQICQGTHIDGTLVYYDPKGELHRVEMKRRRADVVCPIFFTKTHANTAMLRKLVKEKLHNSDVRAFRYPDGLASTSMLELGRRALAGNAIQMVRQYIREGPPYYAEVWYYGETKVKGHQIVMRLGIIEERRALEFFAASTDIEPITGLLAEFKRELDRMLEEGHPGKGPMVPLRSEAVLGEIEGRTLLIDERDGPIVDERQ